MSAEPNDWMSRTPPVPPEADLRHLAWMPVDVRKLFSSSTWSMAKDNPEAGFYAVNLWLSSWHELPAGSLEDNDRVLAGRAMCPFRRWRKVKDLVLRGWVKHSDGRLYHKTVTIFVMHAWAQSCQARARTAVARRARTTKQNQGSNFLSQPLSQPCDSTVDSTDTELCHSSVTELSTAGELEKRKKEKTPPTTSYNFSAPARDANPVPGSNIVPLRNEPLLKPGPELGGGGSVQIDPRFGETYAALETLLGLATPLNGQRIHGWLAAGCDPALDIVPTVKRLVAEQAARHGGPIASLRYFDAAVLRARAERLHPIANANGATAEGPLSLAPAERVYRTSTGRVISQMYIDRLRKMPNVCDTRGPETRWLALQLRVKIGDPAHDAEVDRLLAADQRDEPATASGREARP